MKLFQVLIPCYYPNPLHSGISGAAIARYCVKDGKSIYTSVSWFVGMKLRFIAERLELSWCHHWQHHRLLLYPRFNKVERVVYWFHLVCLSVCLSVHPFVHLSICGQNHVRSVSSTILVGSISYLHILSNNFRRCVTCNVCVKIQKFEILANSLNL